MKTLRLVLLLSWHLIISCVQVEKTEIGTNYYFNAIRGNDSNSGKSADQPWKLLSKIEDVTIQPNDSLLLASGQEFIGAVYIKDAKGTKENPVVVSTYGNKKKPAYVKAKGHLNGVLLENCSFIKVQNLIVTASKNTEDSIIEGQSMRCGILVEVTNPGTYESISLKNIKVSNVFFEEKGFSRPKNEVKTANGTQSYGWGIRFINNTEGALIRDILIDSCIVENLGHTGIKLTSREENKDYGIEDFQISNSKVLYTGGPGIQMSGVKNGHIFNNDVDHSGSNKDSRKWGRGSGLWTWGSRDILIEKNRFTNANGPGDSAGAHIDFNCINVVLQYNLSANNAGGFCEVLGNNYNCSYRYNISVNDGHRIKGENNAFQEGKIFWLSGYVGKNKERTGPFNTYFYNNTIYVKKGIQAKIAIDNKADGILIANNIFHVVSDIIAVKGDQYKPENESQWLGKNVVFENNLFLNGSLWPKELPIKDSMPSFGNPEFAYDGGFRIADYVPNNVKLVKDKGVVISRIPEDSIGLIYGLQVKQDILGNKINYLPDFGAIELQ